MDKNTDGMMGYLIVPTLGDMMYEMIHFAGEA
jgi:hypothetical protein